jgi:2-polyprenyl-3-methyl-5-hydroxy-6-metoxy-1,4-benzoquinol methylase
MVPSPQMEAASVRKDEADSTEFYTPPLGIVLAPYVAARDIAGIHHVGRYVWACEVLHEIRPRRVLDVACGAGYGSGMIARACPDSSVLGADYDTRAVAYAAQHERAPNLDFAPGNMVTWEMTATDGSTRPLGRFDAIISFDTIEHLLHREIALLRIADNLGDDGVLLLSTPCAHPSALLNPGWEHHKIEYSYLDLVPLMRRFFREVAAPDDPAFPNRAFWTRLNTPESLYPNLGNPLVCRGPIRVGGAR